MFLCLKGRGKEAHNFFDESAMVAPNKKAFRYVLHFLSQGILLSLALASVHNFSSYPIVREGIKYTTLALDYTVIKNQNFPQCIKKLNESSAFAYAYIDNGISMYLKDGNFINISCN